MGVKRAKSARKHARNWKDLSGRKFGRLTALREARSIGRISRWLCLCACGQTKVIRAGDLNFGSTKSCGCLRKEAARIRGERKRRAGGPLSKTPEYRSWAGMHERCSKATRSDFKHYGGRGIRVCARWCTFERFLSDMGLRPSTRHSIDRIDVNAHYTPKNCRWATDTEQQRNRRNNVKITFEGAEYTIRALAEKLNADYALFRPRIRAGWPVERALAEPHLRPAARNRRRKA